MNNYDTGQHGFTLITLLVFMLVAIALITTGTTVAINGAKGANSSTVSYQAKSVADSGIENALLRLLRDPDYAGETLEVAGGTATVTVTGTDPKLIRSTGEVQDHIHIQEAEISYTESMVINYWKSIVITPTP